MKLSVWLFALALGGAAWAPLPGAKPACELTFAARTWWPLYRGFSGDGVVRCRGGRVMPVHVVAKGRELSIDRWKIERGYGRYSQLRGYEDLLGHYVRTRDGTRLVRDGNDSRPEAARPYLALSGRGIGFDADEAIDDLRIESAGP